MCENVVIGLKSFESRVVLNYAIWQCVKQNDGSFIIFIVIKYNVIRLGQRVHVRSVI